MSLGKLKYNKEWLEYNFISEEELKNQTLEFENGEDTNTEHYRYKSFLNWIENKSYFTDEQIHQFIHLADIDEDQGMVGSAII